MLSLMPNCIGHLLDDFHCFDADGADSLQQVDDMFFVVGKLVGIEEFGDRRIFSRVSASNFVLFDTDKKYEALVFSKFLLKTGQFSTNN